MAAEIRKVIFFLESRKTFPVVVGPPEQAGTISFLRVFYFFIPIFSQLSFLFIFAHFTLGPATPRPSFHPKPLPTPLTEFAGVDFQTRLQGIGYMHKVIITAKMGGRVLSPCEEGGGDVVAIWIPHHKLF
jgi:hypothetical protein